MKDIPERDWKVFKTLHGAPVERFCSHLLERVTRTATDAKGDPYERVSAVSKLLRVGNKDLDFLADHRRSTALIVIARLYIDHLLTPAEFEQFSPETRDLVEGISHLGEGR